MTTGAAGVESDSKDRSYKFQAFISYKRNVDHEIAASLLEALETYAIPVRIQRDYNVGKRCGRLFKDDDELSAASNLPEALRIALDESKYPDEWLRVKEHVRAREQLREIRALLAGQQRTLADVRLAAWLSAEWMFYLFEGKLAVAEYDRPACTASIQRLRPRHFAGAINARGQAALTELRAACDAL